MITNPLALPTTTRPNVVSTLREDLEARLERALHQGVIGSLQRPEREPEPPAGEDDDIPEFLALFDAAHAAREPARQMWVRHPETGAYKVSIAIDYDDRWRDKERDVLDAIKSAVEGPVALLTRADQHLLEAAPAEFLRLQPGPQEVELLGFEVEHYGQRPRVVSLTLSDRPNGERGDIISVALVPNLIPLERMLSALNKVAAAEPDSHLGPLRRLLGLDGELPEASEPPDLTFEGQLDEFQREAVVRALSTPHFANLVGPPGSGKTTVIREILAHAVRSGLRALVVSPTHSAIDNVVEKLVSDGESRDGIHLPDLAIRYASKRDKVSEAAMPLWVGANSQHRAGTIARRVQRTLTRSLPMAAALFARVDDKAEPRPGLTTALCGKHPVTCGTPIGILSCPHVKTECFDLLIVDEVSKLTLPEFLAVAVKARRWILVGDPAQLPPYCDGVDASVGLTRAWPSLVELACSVSATIDRTPPARRRDRRLVVVARDPGLADRVIRRQLAEHQLGSNASVIVTDAEGLGDATEQLRHGARWSDPRRRASVEILVERGLRVAPPEFASGARLLDEKDRAPAAMFTLAFNTLHLKPWSSRSGVKPRALGLRKAIPKTLPTAGALAVATGESDAVCAAWRDELVETATAHFAASCLSVQDWLSRLEEPFDTAPLHGLSDVLSVGEDIQEAALRYTTTLRRQYRMHPHLSVVPRELFYFGEAMRDGTRGRGKRVRMVEVSNDRRGETNPGEIDAIVELLQPVLTGRSASQQSSVLVITPYRAQEAAIRSAIRERLSDHADEVEVCTLDRCQGREADHVFVSLVRSRASAFMDNPKRWNVALTRARKALFLVGDLDSYRQEARRAMQHPGRPKMSLLAHIITAYDRNA